MKVKCLYNDPSNVGEGIPNDFDYGLEINKEYLVMGIMTFKKSDNLYFLIDEDSLPVPLFVRLTKKFVLVVEI